MVPDLRPAHVRAPLPPSASETERCVDRSRVQVVLLSFLGKKGKKKILAFCKRAVELLSFVGLGD